MWDLDARDDVHDPVRDGIDDVDVVASRVRLDDAHYAVLGRHRVGEQQDAECHWENSETIGAYRSYLRVRI